MSSLSIASDGLLAGNSLAIASRGYLGFARRAGGDGWLPTDRRRRGFRKILYAEEAKILERAEKTLKTVRKAKAKPKARTQAVNQAARFLGPLTPFPEVPAGLNANELLETLNQAEREIMEIKQAIMKRRQKRRRDEEILLLAM